MVKVGAILLAAGLSRRMGAQNKLLLPVGGVPMIRRVAEAYLGLGTVTLVTGHGAEEVERALTGLPIQTTFNPAYAEGQHISVAAGLKAAPQTDLLLIGLGDQALLTTAHLSELIDAHLSANPTKVSVPTFDGQRGNPIVVPHALRPRLFDDPNRPGCMGFTRDQPDHVQSLAMERPAFTTDIDTPEAYAALVEREEA